LGRAVPTATHRLGVGQSTALMMGAPGSADGALQVSGSADAGPTPMDRSAVPATTASRVRRRLRIGDCNAAQQRWTGVVQALPWLATAAAAVAAASGSRYLPGPRIFMSSSSS